MSRGLVILVTLLGGAADADLKRAIADFENFDYDKARVELQQFVGSETPRSVRAKAHSFLGVIAFQQGQPDEGFQQFDAALRDNPTIELPLNTSPKIFAAFQQARQERTRRIEHSAATPAPAAEASSPSEAPANALSTVPLTAAAVEPSHRSHVLAWVLGGVGVVASGVAIYGGVQVLNYDGMAQTTRPGTYDSNAISSAMGSANVWRFGWVIAAAAGAAAFGGAALAW